MNKSHILKSLIVTAFCACTGLLPADQAEWKSTFKSDFAASISYLNDVIDKGENPSQRTEFDNLFKSQQAWVNQKLETIESMNDSEFKKLQTRNKLFHAITRLHKETEPLLEIATKGIEQYFPSMKRLGVLLVYQINPFITRNMKEQSEQASITWSQEDKESLVKSVLYEAVLSRVPPAMIQELRDLINECDELAQERDILRLQVTHIETDVLNLHKHIDHMKVREALAEELHENQLHDQKTALIKHMTHLNNVAVDQAHDRPQDNNKKELVVKEESQSRMALEQELASQVAAQSGRP